MAESLRRIKWRAFWWGFRHPFADVRTGLRHPPREGWVVLLDSDGREVSERIPVVVNCDPLEFTVEHALTFDQIESGIVSAVRVYDIDGTLRDVPLA